MRTFELAPKTKARITDVVVLSQKNRQPDDNPGAQLAISVLLANHDLTMFDGKLKGMLYTKSAASSAPAQQGLEGVEPVSDLPNLSAIGKHLGKIHWKAEYTGFTLVIDQGLGGESDIVVTDCVLSNFNIDAKEGGSVSLEFKLESQDVPADVFGKLAGYKSRDAEIGLTPPEVVQQDIEQPVQKTRKNQAPAAVSGTAPAAGDGYVDDAAFPPGSPEAAFTSSEG